MSESASYQSPFSWRYGSAEMRALWSEHQKRVIWRSIWIALAEAQADFGLVRPEQIENLRQFRDKIDLARAEEIEASIHHDLMSELRVYAEQAPLGGPILHLGATSMDVEDNADAMRLRDALDLLLPRLVALIGTLADQVERWAARPTMAFTHLQPAEPTTIGYRLAQYGQDLAVDLEELRRVRAALRGKGFKGAVGSSASYAQLLGGAPPREMERRVMARLGIEAFEVSTQTAPRKQELRVLNALAGLAQSLYKFAADLRLLQSPPLGEWAEPFGAHQVGSSAMPFKRNPINAENIDSLARLLAAMPRVAWDNAAHSYLERTLDDSANRRSLLPEAFLIADELIRRGTRILGGLRVDEGAADRLLATYGPFAATERVMMELARAGGDRQELHERIREHSLAAWAALRQGQPNPLLARLMADPALTALAPAEAIAGWLNASDYVGDAPERALALATFLRTLCTGASA